RVFVAEAELGGGNAERRAWRRETHVGVQRDREPAADAVALNHREQRLLELRERAAAARGDLSVLPALLRIRALRIELRDVGTGNERFAAGALHHDDAHGGVVLKCFERIAYALPHLERDGVAAFGLVEREPADPVANVRENLLCR